jgi:hypothetical protein
MPLHRNHKLLGLCALQGFDHPVNRAGRSHPKLLPGAIDGLVMA